MRPALPALLALTLLASAQAEWEPRATKDQARALDVALRQAHTAVSEGERQALLRRALDHPRPLLDRLAHSVPAPYDELAWEALALVPAQEQERRLLPIVKVYLLETPQPVLDRLGELAGRAPPRETTTAERLLLRLLAKAEQEPPGDWTNRLRLARALAKGGGERSARALVELLGQANPLTRDGQAVAESLATLAQQREEVVCRTLVRHLQREDDPTQRYLGHTTLAAVASPRTRSYLRSSIRTGVTERHDPGSPVPPDLASAVDALARIDTPSAVDMLLEEEDFIPRDDLPLRLALYRSLAHARRSADSTSLVEALVDWLGEAERESAPKELRMALVETLRALTGKRLSAHHASWVRYLARRDQ